jgi:PAS domain S-box-containing protein
MVAAACLTLAAVHLLIWCGRRSQWACLLFFLAAAGTAAMAGGELLMMRVGTPGQFAAVLRWYHVPAWIVMLSLVGFVRIYLRAGRPWLAWAVCGVRTLSLLLGFATGQNLNFREVVDVRQVLFLGESVSVGVGVVNPWVLTEQLSQLLLAVFAADAAVAVWRRGDRWRALTVGGSIAVFPLFGAAAAVLVFWGGALVPVIISPAFLGVVVAMAWAFSRETSRATQLADDLRASEARYRGIFEGATEGMFRTSVQGKCLVANPALVKMLGYGSAEEFTREIEDVAHQVWAEPEERARYVQRVEEHGAVRAYECQFKRKDGTRIWVSLSTCAVRGADGRVAYYDGFVEEISERKRMEEALRTSEERLREATEAAGFGVYSYDFSGGKAFYSPEFLALYGLPPDAVLELGPDLVPKAVHPDDRALFLACSKQSSDPCGPGVFEVEFRVLGKDGQMRWLRAHGRTIFDDDGPSGRPVRANGIIHDVTLRKQAEETLRRNELRLASAIDIADLGFYEQSHEERTTFIDRRAQAIVGFHGEQDDENAVFKFWAKHLCPEDSLRVLNFHRELDEGAVDRVTADYRYQHPQRGVIWIHHLVHVVDRKDGKRVRTIGVFQDITERKEADLALARGRAEVTHLARVAMLGELSGAIAHELNQPLTAILSNAQAAQRFLADDQPDLNDLRDILDDIVHDDQRAGEVIRRLRSLLKKGEVSRQPLNLDEIVRDVLRLAHNDLHIRNIATRTNFAHGLAATRGDRVQLQQVLLNLIMNAADAVETCEPADRQIFVGTEAAGPEGVRVSVIDSGPGIPPDVLSRLFDPFVTTKSHGLGLGLKVCRTIIESHGGQITGGNNPGRGATFAFTLPAEGIREEEGAGHGE